MISSLATMSRDGLGKSNASPRTTSSSFFRASSERHLPNAVSRQQQQHQHSSAAAAMTSAGVSGNRSTAVVDGLSTFLVGEGTPLLLMSASGNRTKPTVTNVDGTSHRKRGDSTTEHERAKKKTTKDRAYKKYVRSTSVSLPVDQSALTLPKTMTSIAIDEGTETARSGKQPTSTEYLRVSGDFIQLIEVGQRDHDVADDDRDIGHGTYRWSRSRLEDSGSTDFGVDSKSQASSLPTNPRTLRDVTIPCGGWLRRSSSATTPDKSTALSLPCDSAFWSNFNLGESANATTALVGGTDLIRKGELPMLLQPVTSRTSPLLVGVNSARCRILKKTNGKNLSSTWPEVLYRLRTVPSDVLQSPVDCEPAPTSPQRMRKSATLTSKFWSTSFGSATLTQQQPQVKMSKSSSELQQPSRSAAAPTSKATVTSARRAKFLSLGNVQHAWKRRRRTTAPPTSLQLLPTSMSLLSSGRQRSKDAEISPSTAAAFCRKMGGTQLPFKGRTVSTTAVYGDENESDVSSAVTSLTESQSIESTPNDVRVRRTDSITLKSTGGGGGGGGGVVANARYGDTRRQLKATNEPRASRRGTRIRINVSGQCFETRIVMLDRHPNTLLGDSIRRLRFYDVARRELFFDRHRPSFEAIFTYLQTGGRLRRPYHVPDDVFLAELEFYELEADVVDDYKRSEGHTFEESPMPSNPYMRRVWELFEYPETSKAAFAVALFSVVMTLVSIVLFCVETLPVFQTSHCVGNEAPNFGDPFFVLETLCTVWFTIEAICRYIACPSKIDFWKDFKNVVDVMAVIPYYVTLFNVLSTMSCSSAKSSASLSFLRVIRLIRVFKLTKHSVGLQVLMLTFRASLEGLGLFLVALLVSLLVFSSAIYYAELDCPRSKMVSIPDAFWWAIITMTTVGYGDYVPVSIPGRLIGAACAITGVLTLAIPVPIITGHFNRFYAHKTGRGRHA